MLVTALIANPIGPPGSCRRRRERGEPALERLHKRLTKKGAEAVLSTLLNKAVGFTLGESAMLVRYLDRTELSPETNAVERAIRPFVIAVAATGISEQAPAVPTLLCALYSLLDTARQDNLNPYPLSPYTCSTDY